MLGAGLAVGTSELGGPGFQPALSITCFPDKILLNILNTQPQWKEMEITNLRLGG